MLILYCRLSVVHRFSSEQVDCMCEALLQQYPASRSRLVTLVSSLSSTQLQRSDSEHLLRARAVAAFHTGRFTDLYAILTGTHVFDPAHHPLLQKVTYVNGISLIKYRLVLAYCCHCHVLRSPAALRIVFVRSPLCLSPTVFNSKGKEVEKPKLACITGVPNFSLKCQRSQLES